MNLFYLSYKNLVDRPLSSLLSWLLLSFGVCIVVLILQFSDKFQNEATRNTTGIDLVIGAKGSPLQIILCSIFHIDFPTGNIEISDIIPFTKNRYIEQTIPLSLGDSYNGFRIVGTVDQFAETYQLKIRDGEWFDQPMKAVIGFQVAEKLGLQLGDEFASQHGLDEGGEIHGGHSFEVVGIMEETGLVADKLILVDLTSIWLVHEHGSEPQEHLEENHSEKEAIVNINGWDLDLTESQVENEQITSLLVTYRSPMGAVMIPNLINATSNLQAASPAFESARLFSILENALKVLNYLGLIIILISGISVFISLLNSLKERQYEIAIMRSIGSSRFMVFSNVLIEGFILSGIGVMTGLVVSHSVVSILFSSFVGRSIPFFSFAEGELLLLISCLGIGIFAAAIPALMAYRTDISKTLAQG